MKIKKIPFVMCVVSVLTFVFNVMSPLSSNVANALPAPTNFDFSSLEDSLAAYWPFDDNMVDYTGNGNNAVTTTAYYDASGVGGRSLYFNSLLPSMVTIPDDPSINNFTDEMSF
jgi:hypothetical protein